jgi:hypothetical protein
MTSWTRSAWALVELAGKREQDTYPRKLRLIPSASCGSYLPRGKTQRSDKNEATKRNLLPDGFADEATSQTATRFEGARAASAGVLLWLRNPLILGGAAACS